LCNGAQFEERDVEREEKKLLIESEAKHKKLKINHRV
jgi:hypothetical protein